MTNDKITKDTVIITSSSNKRIPNTKLINPKINRIEPVKSKSFLVNVGSKF